MKGIYLITNKINQKKYVGMSNNIQRRFMEHKTPKNIKNMTTVLSRAFRKYSIENFTFEILELVSDINDLASREIYWINKIKPEYNMNEGGRGNKGMPVSEEIREILRVAGKLQWASKTDAEKQLFAKTNLKGAPKGHKVSEEAKEKLRIHNLGKKQSQKTIDKRSKKMKVSMKGNQNGNKSIIQLDLDGNYIEEYKSAVIASQYIGIHPSGITSVLKGTQKTAGGFKWKYSN